MLIQGNEKTNPIFIQTRENWGLGRELAKGDDVVLEGYTFEDIDFDGYNLSYARFRDCSFINCKFTVQTTIYKSSISCCLFRECVFDGLIIQHSIVGYTYFTEIKGERLTILDCHAVELMMNKADLDKLSVVKSYLNKSLFEQTFVKNTKFEGSVFYYTNFRRFKSKEGYMLDCFFKHHLVQDSVFPNQRKGNDLNLEDQDTDTDEQEELLLSSNELFTKYAGLEASVQEWNDFIKNTKAFVDLEALRLEALDLTGICFDNCSLEEATFIDCNLTNASFEGSSLPRTSFIECNVKGANFEGAYLDNSSFRGSEVDEQTRLKEAYFSYDICLDDIVNFHKLDIPSDLLIERIAYSADNKNKIKQWNNLRYMNCNTPRLCLRDMLLGNCSMPGIHFQNASLEGTDFSNSNLQDCVIDMCNIDGVDFTGADLTGAVITNCDLRKVKGIEALRKADVHHCLTKGGAMDQTPIKRAALKISNSNNPPIRETISHPVFTPVYAYNPEKERFEIGYGELTILGEK